MQSLKKIFIVFLFVICFLGCSTTGNSPSSKVFYKIKAIKTGQNELRYMDNKQFLLSNKEKSIVGLYPRMDSIDISKNQTMMFGLIVRNIANHDKILLSLDAITARTDKYEMQILNYDQAYDYVYKKTESTVDLRGLGAEEILAFRVINPGIDYHAQQQRQQIFKILGDKYLKYQTVSPQKTYEGLFMTSLPYQSNQFGIRITVLGEFHDFYFSFN